MDNTVPTSTLTQEDAEKLTPTVIERVMRARERARKAEADRLVRETAETAGVGVLGRL